jgi:peptide deformylase
MTDLPHEYELLTGARNPILRSVSQPVKKITKEVREFCAILIDKMYDYNGVGLAAPQIWRLERIISVTFWKKDKKGEQDHIGDEVMINPHITAKSKEMFSFEEACLSLPRMRGDVMRHRHITVEYTTPDWKKHIKKLSDMSAVIIQHEIDHLDGILFIDKTMQ